MLDLKIESLSTSAGIHLHISFKKIVVSIKKAFDYHCLFIAAAHLILKLLIDWVGRWAGG